jgi:D-alanyl-D-alanine endopeptidase (penicillin-binding protein 7)
LFPCGADAATWEPSGLSGHHIIDSFNSPIGGSTLQKGYTVTLQNKEAMLAIPSQIMDDSFRIRVDSIDLLPGGEEHVRTNELHVGPIIEVHYDAASSELDKDFTLRIKVNRPGRYNRIWLRRWNERTQTWDRIRNQVDALHTWAVANFKEPGIYAAFESQDVEEGTASWFGDRRTLVAAHNGYPIGSHIRVTNLDNAQSIVVTVVSRGPYVSGRVVDLSHDAFSRIASSGQGVARVGVWAVDALMSGQVLGESVSQQNPPPSQPTPPPVASKPLVANKDIDPLIRARAYVSMNADTGEIISAKNGDQKYPLASLTKLMTALVVLDNNPDWGKLVTYEPDDDAQGAKLYIDYGDKVNVRDLWYTMLVGSANNAAKMLRKSTGLSVEEFRNAMNVKAKSLGLSTLSFYEPTGLDVKNVGSASDYARLAQLAFTKDKIREATTMKTYFFRTAGRNEAHTITNENNMIGSGWNLTGTKTGYTDEALYNLVAQVTGVSTGKHIIGVTLGSPSDSIRYQDMVKSLNAGFKPYL